MFFCQSGLVTKLCTKTSIKCQKCFVKILCCRGCPWLLLREEGAVDESSLEVFFPSCSAVPSEV